MSDIAVIGTGPNGSVAAFLLARRGHRVTLLEDGEDDPVGRAWLSGGLEHVPYLVEELGLVRFGVRPVEDRPTLIASLGAGQAAPVPLAAPEAGAFGPLFAAADRLAALILAVGRAAPVGAPRAERDRWALAELESRLHTLPSDDRALFVALMTGSLSDLLAPLDAPEPLKAALALDLVLDRFVSPLAPASAYALLHRRMAPASAEGGAALAGPLAAALEAACAAAGILRATAPAARIHAGPEGPEAVELADGRQMAADLVLLATSPATARRLLRRRAQPPPPQGAALRLVAELGPGVRLPAEPPLRLAIVPSLRDLGRAARQARTGGASSEPAVLVTVPEGGRHALVMAQYLDPAAPDAGEALEAATLATLDEALPGLVDRIERIATLPPGDLLGRRGAMGQDLQHAALAGLAPTRLTPLSPAPRRLAPGIWLAGPEASPAGLHVGLAGDLVARAAGDAVG